MNPVRSFAVSGVVVGVLTSAVAGVVVPPVATAKQVRNGLIAYTTGDGVPKDPYAIWTIKPDGTGNSPILGPRPRHDDMGPAGPRWSRDGRKLLFARWYQRGGLADFAPTLWYSTASGKHIKRIPLGPGLGGLSGYDWAPDGRSVVFGSSRASTSRPGNELMIFTIRIDGTHRKVLRHGQYPSWSSDGRYIVFTRIKFVDDPKDPQVVGDGIAVVHPDGTGFKRLTSLFVDEFPSFSPDGTKVVYVRPDNYFPPVVADYFPVEWRVVDVTGRHDVLVTVADPPGSADHGCPPQFTPDGSHLAELRTHATASLSTPLVPFTRSLATFALARRDEHTAFRFPSTSNAGSPGGCDFSWQPRG
jgi:Tol biopolymer transport system component